MSSSGTLRSSKYWVPRYWRNRNVSVANHVFCNSISIKCSLPSFSRILAEKSRRNNEILDRPESVYSCWRICTSNTSFCNKAESNTLATLLSSIKNLNTESYIGFAIIVITLTFLILPKDTNYSRHFNPLHFPEALPKFYGFSRNTDCRTICRQRFRHNLNQTSHPFAFLPAPFSTMANPCEQSQIPPPHLIQNNDAQLYPALPSLLSTLFSDILARTSYL